MTATPHSFASLPLTANTLANLTQLGYTAMTPIQAASLPLSLAGRDVLGEFGSVHVEASRVSFSA